MTCRPLASGKGAVIAAWSGFGLAVIAWLSAAQITSGKISVATLGDNRVMLSGNLVAILSSGFIHFVYSKFFDNEEFDFATLDAKIQLVEQDLSGLGVSCSFGVHSSCELHILNHAFLSPGRTAGQGIPQEDEEVDHRQRLGSHDHPGHRLATLFRPCPGVHQGLLCILGPCVCCLGFRSCQ